MKKRLICLSLIFAMSATQVVPVAAAGKANVQTQKSATQNKLSDTEEKVENLESQKNALMSQISSAQQDLVSVMTQINMLDDSIAAKETDIQNTQEELKTAEAERNQQYEDMKKRIQYLYETGGSTSWAQALLESSSITDMLSKVETSQKVYDYDREALEKLKDAVEAVENLETQLENEKSELETSKQEQEGVQQSLTSQITNLKASASDYEAQIAAAKAQAAKYQALVEQQNAIVQGQQSTSTSEDKTGSSTADNKNTSNGTKTDADTNAAESTGSQTNQNSGSEKNETSGSSSNNTQTVVDQTPSEPETDNTTNDNAADNNTATQEPSGTEETPAADNNTQEETTSTPDTSYNSSIGKAIVAYAKQFIGNPYVYGGNSLTDGIDCSGFTQQIYAHFGYSLPRTSDAQASVGTEVSWSEHKAGDLIVYPGHVAILTGDGGIVHASNSKPYPEGGIKYTSNALYTSYITIRRIAQ